MPLPKLLARRRALSLPDFTVAPLDFEAGDELVLDDIVASIGALADGPHCPPFPTAGELRESIERHLRSVTPQQPNSDATDELRHALVQLRRSIG